MSELDKDVKVDMLNLPKFNRGSNIVTSITNRIPWIKKVVEQYKPDAILVEMILANIIQGIKLS